MKFTKLEKDILQWIHENEEDPVIQNQILAAKPAKREFTAVGMWLHVELEGTLKAVEDSEGDVSPIPGPVIESPELEQGAESVIYITNGFFDTMEIFTPTTSFPKELFQYQLKQSW